MFLQTDRRDSILADFGPGLQRARSVQSPGDHGPGGGALQDGPDVHQRQPQQGLPGQLLQL